MSIPHGQHKIFRIGERPTYVTIKPKLRCVGPGQEQKDKSGFLIIKHTR